MRFSVRRVFSSGGCSSFAGFIVFVIYVSLFIFHGILITATQSKDKHYEYNTITVVLATELLKLIISLILYWNNRPITSLIKDIRVNVSILGLYLVPACLYCLYNNLAFVNLSNFDPTTYFLLLQFRVVITGILFQFIFKKWLTFLQWVSLILLTVGCLIKQLEFDWGSMPSFNVEKLANIRIVFILIQSGCSCFAGVYNEYLLKKKGSTADIYIQNIFMYLDSILFNLFAIVIITKDPLSAFSLNGLSKLNDYRILLIIINSALVGIITSFFLKKFNSIVKVFAGALELVCTAMFSYFLFNIPILANTILSILIVSIAMTMYTLSPVRNNKNNSSTTETTTHQSPCAPNIESINQQPVAIGDFDVQNKVTDDLTIGLT